MTTRSNIIELWPKICKSKFLFFKFLYFRKQQFAEKRETEAFELVAQKDKEMCKKIMEIEAAQKGFQNKKEEIDTLNKKLLKIQDEKLDVEAKLESREGKEHALKEEIVVL